MWSSDQRQDVDEAWADTVLALGVERPALGTNEDGVLWSPVLQRHAKVTRHEAWFLRQFAGGLRPSERWPLGVEVADHAVTGDGAVSLAQLYLRLQKYLLLGVLVEQVTLRPEEIGALHVSATPDDVAPTGMIRKGRAPTNVREMCARDESHRHAVPLRFDRHPPTASALRVCRRSDGELALLDGVEVACAAYLAGSDAPAHVLRPADFVRRVADSPTDFFGTMRGGVPYQSIYRDGEELVVGRRRALYERLRLIRPGDVQDKRILDIGCNLGMNCYLAIELGAAAATGVDRPVLAMAAARLNGFYGRRCRFVAADLNHAIRDIGVHETVFAFSLLGHLATTNGLLETIEQADARAVYVESHRDGEEQGELDDLLRSPRFAHVELVGHCDNSAIEEHKTRCLYRCEVRNGSR